ncbi:MAG: pilus assembly protein PilM [Kiritimatiellae bacterium]|nr:pilus assembly protein PilM [Kiritimatiellia bacterium]
MLVRELIAGLDVGEEGVAAACVTASRDGLTVTHGGYEPVPEGAGEAEVARVIRHLWRRGRMPSRLVCTALGGGAVLLQNFRYEGLTEEQVRSAVRLEAEEALQIPSSELVLDCHIAGRNGGGHSGEGCEGIFAAAPRAAVDQYRRRLELAGVVPVVLDAAPLALANLWLWLARNRSTDEVVFVVDIGRRQAHIAQISREGRAAARTVVFGAADGEAISDYLAENIASQQEYAEARFGMPAARRLLLTGVRSEDERLRAGLARELAVAVEEWIPLGDPQIRCEGRARALVSDAGLARRMSVCLGLALRGLEDGDH